MTVPGHAIRAAGVFMMASKSTSAIDDGHRTKLTLTPASRTVSDAVRARNWPPLQEAGVMSHGNPQRDRSRSNPGDGPCHRRRATRKRSVMIVAARRFQHQLRPTDRNAMGRNRGFASSGCFSRSLCNYSLPVSAQVAIAVRMWAGVNMNFGSNSSHPGSLTRLEKAA